MKTTLEPSPSIAIACGGTGGHFYPGLTVGEALRRRGWEVTLLISPKEVDQAGARTAAGMKVETLPASAFSNGRRFAFLTGSLKSYFAARKLFAASPPAAVLAMGGFTSAPPVLAAWRSGARTFIHESNSIPGRANRLLARRVDHAFVGFPEAAAQLRTTSVTVTGTPVRSQFRPMPPGQARMTLGLDPRRPVLLVMGGSQGASGLNERMMDCLPTLISLAPELQFIHLTGTSDMGKVRARYDEFKRRALVQDFSPRMDLVLGAAIAAVSRAGASALAEFAAMRVPALLMPLPTAADNHQFHNARAFERSGAAFLLEQKNASPGTLARMICRLTGSGRPLDDMCAALAKWHKPRAAEEIADFIIKATSNSAGEGIAAK
jgi:UDP-N-acetylglucosamine--N-acetylmuramyl-(pentapeptide) pyrophosphoryl-undecaprenol N-acetylglucosamine transferase